MDKMGDIWWRDGMQRPIKRVKFLPKIRIILFVDELALPSAPGTAVKRNILLIDGIDLL
jgi:hypothetical protein